MDETEQGTWQPPFYELYVEFQGHSTERLIAALTRLWEADRLSGPFARHDISFAFQPPVSARSGVGEIGSALHLYGTARLPDTSDVVCGSIASSGGADDGGDTMTFYLPWGTLESIGRDFESEDGPGDSDFWNSLDDWLAEIGRGVFDVAPFAVAAVGPEVTPLEAVEAARRGRLNEFAKPHPGLLVPIDGHLTWTPSTN